VRCIVPINDIEVDVEKGLYKLSDFLVMNLKYFNISEIPDQVLAYFVLA